MSEMVKKYYVYMVYEVERSRYGLVRIRQLSGTTQCIETARKWRDAEEKKGIYAAVFDVSHRDAAVCV